MGDRNPYLSIDILCECDTILIMDYSKQPETGYHANKEWYARRDASLYADKKSGNYSNAQLITKYGISLGRIRYLIENERKKHEFQRTR